MSYIPPAFSSPGTWLRGNIHIHTSASDGRFSPAEALRWYDQNGYDFAALTDHLVLCDAFDALDVPPAMLLLPGVEIHGEDPQRGIYHLVGVGGNLRPGQNFTPADSMQKDIDRLLDLGMLIFAAHPYWSGQSARDLLLCRGLTGMEVYNATADVGYAKGYSLQTWDELLSAGRPLWGLAADDAHWLPWRDDAGKGWLMVKTAERSTDAILSALRDGRFYATMGPSIDEILLEGGAVHVKCSPAVSISAIGERWHCRVARSSTPDGLTAAALSLWPGQQYVRVEVMDKLGRRAWSNPIFLDDLEEAERAA